MPMQPVPSAISTEPVQAPASVTAPASVPDIGVPREASIVARYLPDPSLRYSRVPFAGPGALGAVMVTLLFLASVASVLVAVVTLAVHRQLMWVQLGVLVGVPLGLELMAPVRRTLVDWANQAWFWRHVRVVELGLDRSVPQAGSALRYEVHLAARRTMELHSAQLRVVFWENWCQKSKTRWLRIPRVVVEKRGHDLVRHQVAGIRLLRDQHAVIRGTVRMPANRPTEHNRGKPRHVSYVNITTTLVVAKQRPARVLRGNYPHLITFPWL